MTRVSRIEQEQQGLTGCFDDIMCSASGRATPGLLSQLAMSRREILPPSMLTPWAGSNRYKISELVSFTAERPPPVGSPSLPFWVRFNEPLRMRRQDYGFTRPYQFAATLDTGPLAKSYPRGNHTRLSSNHLQSAPAWLCSAITAILVSQRNCGTRISIPLLNSILRATNSSRSIEKSSAIHFHSTSPSRSRIGVVADSA